MVSAMVVVVVVVVVVVCVFCVQPRCAYLASSRWLGSGVEVYGHRQGCVLPRPPGAVKYVWYGVS